VHHWAQQPISMADIISMAAGLRAVGHHWPAVLQCLLTHSTWLCPSACLPACGRSFDPTALSVGFIDAVGSSPTFAFHKHSTSASLDLWPSAAAAASASSSGGGHACICTQLALPFGSASGKIHYLPTGEKVGFPAGRCSPQPRGDLLVQRNP
jgi:hypothetical protein